MVVRGVRRVRRLPVAVLEVEAMNRHEQSLTDLGYRLAFCRACARREAWHRPDGTCANADRHADKVCADCGRQCSGERCSACIEAAS